MTFKDFHKNHPAKRIGPRRWTHAIFPNREYTSRGAAEKAAHDLYLKSGKGWGTSLAVADSVLGRGQA